MTIVHCSYHKCLTVYYQRVMGAICNSRFRRPLDRHVLRRPAGYRHFHSRLDHFYENLGRYRALSVNNHALDLERLGDDVRISRFIRDPRDLVVSGYFYHRNGTEAWSTVVDPSPEDWRIVNGTIPSGMRPGESYSGYLQRLPREKGLMAEVEFRGGHFRSMREWPASHPRVRTFHYEDVLGNERAVFRRMFSFYGVSYPEREAAGFLAWRNSARRQARRTAHIRNPKAGQWRKHFTPAVSACLDERHPGLLDHVERSR